MLNPLLPVGIKKNCKPPQCPEARDSINYIHRTESQLLDDGPHTEDLGPMQMGKKHSMEPLKTMSHKP